MLANPHFPWHGPRRLYQSHLVIPGKVNVSGASLFGVPLVNIGTNEGSISFILKNAGLVAEEIFGFVWVLFTAPKED